MDLKKETWVSPIGVRGGLASLGVLSFYGVGRGGRTAHKASTRERESCKLRVTATANHDFKDNEKALLEAS